MNHIEFRNETDEDRNVVVCRTQQGNLYVHLLGDDEEIHDDTAATVPARDYAHVDVNNGKL